MKIPTAKMDKLIRHTTMLSNRRVGGVGMMVLCFLLVAAAMSQSGVNSERQQAENFVGSIEETIQLGSKSRLIVETRGVKSEYGPGDTIILRWVDGIAFIDDHQIHPLLGADKDYPVDRLRKMYGQVPLVLHYVEGHDGERPEREIWNQAATMLAARIDDAVREAGDHFSLLVTDNGNATRVLIHPDSAAVLVALALCEKTELIASATGYGPPHRDPRDIDGYLSIRWKGMEGHPEIIELKPTPLNTGDSSKNVNAKESTVPNLLTQELFEQLYAGPLRLLSESGKSIAIMVKDGTMDIGSGHVDQERQEEPR